MNIRVDETKDVYMYVLDETKVYVQYMHVQIQDLYGFI